MSLFYLNNFDNAPWFFYSTLMLLYSSFHSNVYHQTKAREHERKWYYFHPQPHNSAEAPMNIKEISTKRRNVIFKQVIDGFWLTLI